MAHNELWGKEIQADEVKTTNKIGEGMYGKVFKGICRATEVAVKVPNRQQLSPAELASFKKEIDIMRNITHPNVCLFMGATADPGNIKIVTELMKGDIESLIFNSPTPSTVCERLHWCLDAAKGMAWLHDNDPCIIHRDIKPSNLLIDARGTVKVTDFGLSDLIQVGQQFKEVRPRGSPIYMAPEVMRRDLITPKVDVYSFGILIWEVVKKEAAFSHHSDYNKFSKAVVDGERPNTEGLHPDLAKFLTQCWNKDPKERPDFKDVCKSLEDVILSIAIEDDNARMFWKFNFGGRFSVATNDLLRKMYNAVDNSAPFPIDEPNPLPSNPSDKQISQATHQQRREYARRSENNFRDIVTKFEKEKVEEIDLSIISFKLLLTKKDKTSEVEIEAFGHFTSLLGPFDKKLVERVNKLIRTDWFHGDLSKTDAESRLRNEKPGTFLVRFSTNNPGCYVISRVSSDKSTKHVLISHNKDGSFSIKGAKDAKIYATFDDLLKSEGKANNLLHACPCSIFKTLLEPQSGYN